MDETQYDPTTGTIVFAKGGFQGARGMNCHVFYINVIFLGNI